MQDVKEGLPDENPDPSCRDLASKITAEERDVAVERLTVYKRWFLEHVMREGERDTLVLIPIENISPRYRDEPLP